jgi:hypothetical protein
MWDLAINILKLALAFSLLYNQVGDRLYATGEVGNNPAWYEHFRPLLDFQVSQRFWKNKGSSSIYDQ